MHATRLIPAALVVLAATACGGSAEAETRAAGAECEDYIAWQLELPDDAVFGASPEITPVESTSEDLRQYEVAGTFDTEDGPSTAYTCFITNNSGDWVVVDLRTEER
ncbi:hypothetical protein [Nocardiopsis trehalosi]|jgi:hypothetical protein|uniref:hypothetical protein n=1 Tax=Nocardiopsis trehalosi TaxID=109329 RepID=UPI00082E64B0|nr:hypothetical protein [Nocardiopsis trehalosi]